MPRVMDWFYENWQTIAVLGVVGLTMVVFVIRLVKKKKRRAGCGEGCECEGKKIAGRSELSSRRR